ncbi:MAG: dTMP kinase, partial [Candidatus Bipolaricaulota bacterium]
MQAKGNGKLIVFEGLDGSGTTTQVSLLAECLKERGFSVIKVEEPGGTPLGRKVRDLLLDDKGLRIDPLSELLLYEVSRAQLIREKIIPELNRGSIVISDRFAISSVAYQGYGRGIPIERVKKLNEIAVAGVEPDITFFLDIDLEEREKRTLERKPDRIEKEELEFYRRVKQGYLEEMKSASKAVVIDGSSSKEEIASEVISKIDELI